MDVLRFHFFSHLALKRERERERLKERIRECVHVNLLFSQSCPNMSGEGEPMSTVGNTEKQDLLTHNCIPIISLT